MLPSQHLFAGDTTCHKMFRVYEDNDIFKLLGDMSDKGYTNGTRFDYFYTSKSPRFFVDRWMPKAGKEAVNTFGWGITQIMYTPENYQVPFPDVEDWPYSGALYLSHSLHSVNVAKTYNIQSEIMIGVTGRASLVEPVQKFIHQLIGSPRPEGWGNQYPTDLVLNFSFAAEKLVWQYHNLIDVTGGGQVIAGTMLDGASVYAQIRFGKMQPYFNGLIQQFARPFSQKNRLQCYLVMRPSLEWVGYNAILEGGVFRGKSDYYKGKTTPDVNHEISRRLDIGLVLGYGKVSLSFTQRIMPKLVDGFYHQRLGNLSLYVGL